MKGTIYCIREISSVKIIYVGSTTDLCKRKSQHKHDCYNRSKEIPIYQHIRSICPDRNDFDNYFCFDELKTVDVRDRKELRQVEEKYIRENPGTFNQVKAFQSKEEMREYIREYFREYAKTEKRKDYQREYHKSEKYKEYNRKYKREHRQRKNN